MIGPLQPADGQVPHFLQSYIHDPHYDTPEGQPAVTREIIPSLHRLDTSLKHMLSMGESAKNNERERESQREREREREKERELEQEKKNDDEKRRERE
jgi:hypothetical protein